jgi:hypothetical protein
MNIHPFAADDHIPTKEVFTLSFEELQGCLQQLYTALEQTITAVGSSAEVPSPGEEPSLNPNELEDRFKKTWQALESTVEAISTSAILAEYTAWQFDKLADAAGEGMLFLQTVTSGWDITPLWLARRDGIVAQASKPNSPITRFSCDHRCSATIKLEIAS